MSRATDILGIMSAIMSTSFAMVAHAIVDSVCSGVRALIRFPIPWLIAIEA